MTTRFRQIKDAGGVDEGAGPMDAGIVVPNGGSSLVFLEDGKRLKLVSSHRMIERPGNQRFVERPTRSDSSKIAIPVLAVLTGLNSGERPVLDQRTRPRRRRQCGQSRGVVVASLTVILMPPKPVKVALRQIQAIKDGKDLAVSSQTSFDPAAMLIHMNAVWTPQTNIKFSLGRIDPVPVKEIAFESGPSRTNSVHAQALANAIDPSADLTIFFARSVFDPPIGSSSTVDIRQKWLHRRQEWLLRRGRRPDGIHDRARGRSFPRRA